MREAVKNESMDFEETAMTPLHSTPLGTKASQSAWEDSALTDPDCRQANVVRSLLNAGPWERRNEWRHMGRLL